MRLSGTKTGSVNQYRGLGNQLWDLAGNLPTLDLRFAESKSLNDSVSGSNLITFTRPTGGSYVDSDGLIKVAGINTPRFDHNPATGECLGLLIEEMSINELARSEQFDNGTSWTINSATVTANSVTSPNGTQTADLLTSTTSATFSRAWQSILASGSVITASCYLRADVPFTGSLRLQKDGVEVVVKDISIGTNWQRFEITDTSAFTSNCEFHIFLNSNGTAGSSVSGRSLYLWGAQLEEKAFATSYIGPTLGSGGLARMADTVSITGSNFLSWYRQDEGTVFVEVSPSGPAAAGNEAFVAIESAFNNSIRIIQQVATDRAVVQVQIPSGLQVNSPLGIGALSRNETIKVGLAIKENDFYGIRTGGFAITDTTAAVPTGLTSLELGFTAIFPTTKKSFHVSRLTYWPERLPNATLQTITTP